jgi:hypothetical protein
MAELLSSIKKDKMTSGQKDRLMNMCLKLSAEPKNPSGLDWVGCQMGGREIRVKEDFSSATVKTDDVRNEEFQIQGTVQEVENIHMEMLGDPDKREDVSKVIKVEGDDGDISFSNHDVKPEGGRISPNR